MSRVALIMAGGTGGHVIPALAVAKALQSRSWDVEWLGTSRGIESRIVPANDIKLHTIGVEGLRGRGVLSLLKAPFMLLTALFQAMSVVRSVRPDVVIGLGGFASGPGGFVARLLGLPLVVHEQNAVAGTTNRLLAKLTKHRLTGFPGVLDGQYVGNPVPKPISLLPQPTFQHRGLGTLLVVGGSLGALALNQNVPKALSLIDASCRPRIIHQSGRNKRDETIACYEDAGVEAEVVEFIDDMAGAYSSADVVICRSGALTVSELSCIGKPSILVPYPFAIDNHQRANADFLARNGAATVVEQVDWNDKEVAAILSDYLNPDGLLIDALGRQFDAAIRDADDVVANYVVNVLEGKV
jgi:UDP-N-acetylglucosamine--N-acetylmuramyl-(pentapeptide) pyrophosphoryl-undecaprenol N-acetylglucosamine transferase